MSDQLIDAFDDCATALMEGASLDECLARYPELAEELRPLLLTAAGVQNTMNSVKVPQQAQVASRDKFLAGAIQARNSIQPERKRIYHPLSLLTRRAVFISICILLGLIVGTYGVVHASTKSLPGDLLYGVKRTTEKTRLLFSTSPEKHAILEDQISQRRAQEAHEITRQARTRSIEFGGRLESLKGDLSVVAGVPVIILPDTQIEGNPEIGLYVWVSGKSQSDQTVKASTIRVQGIRIRGEVISMHKPDWQVDQSEIVVKQSTQITGNPKIGDQVDVNARVLSDGQLLAEEITLLTQSEKPTGIPLPQPAPTVTGTPRVPRHFPTPDPEPGGSHEGAVTFTGLVRSMNPGEWKIGDEAVKISPTTQIHGSPRVGQMVEVQAYRNTAGELVAIRIDITTEGSEETQIPKRHETPEGTPGRPTAAPPEDGDGRDDGRDRGDDHRTQPPPTDQHPRSRNPQQMNNRHPRR